MSVSQRQEAKLSLDIDTGLTYWHTFFIDLFLASKWFKWLDPLKYLPCTSLHRISATAFTIFRSTIEARNGTTQALLSNLETLTDLRFLFLPSIALKKLI